jgi:PEP-CTERM motif
MPLRSALACLSLAALLLAPAAASALSIAPSVFGKGNDFSDPLDGVAEEVVVSTSTQDLHLNAVSGGLDPLVSEARGIIEFDVIAAAPLGVSSATLVLPVLDAVTSVGTIALYAYGGNDSLDISDFAQLGSFVTNAAVTVPEISIDVTAAVQAAYASSFGKIGFVVTMTAEDQLLSLWNPGETQSDPRLVVTPSVPEPSVAQLLGLGVGAAGLAARRRAVR